MAPNSEESKLESMNPYIPPTFKNLSPEASVKAKLSVMESQSIQTNMNINVLRNLIPFHPNKFRAATKNTITKKKDGKPKPRLINCSLKKAPPLPAMF